MNKGTVFGIVFASLIWASAANADTTVRVEPGDRLVDLLRGSGITLGQLKDANHGKIPSVCRSTKTVVGRRGTWTLCLRPRSYLVAGTTLVIPDSRAALEARAAEAEELKREIARQRDTINSLLDENQRLQEGRATSSNPQHSEELGQARSEIEALKRSRASEIASLKQRHGRELQKARAEAKRLSETIRRERREHSRSEDELEKAVRAARENATQARIVVKRVPSSAYKPLATVLGIGLAIFAFVGIGMGATLRKKNRRIRELEIEKRGAERLVQNSREEMTSEREALQRKTSLEDLERKDQLANLNTKLSEAEEAKQAHKQKMVELVMREDRLRQDEQALQHALADHEAEKASLQEHLKLEARQEVAKELDGMRAEIRRLEEAAEERERESSFERNRLLSQEDRISSQFQADLGTALEKAKAEYEGRISDLQKQLNDKTLEAEELSEQNVDLHGELDVQKAKLAAAEEKAGAADALEESTADSLAQLDIERKETVKLRQKLDDELKRISEQGERGVKMLQELKTKHQAELAAKDQEIESLKASIQPRPVPALPEERPKRSTPPLPMPAVSAPWTPPAIAEEKVEDITEASGLLDITGTAEAAALLTQPGSDQFVEGISGPPTQPDWHPGRARRRTLVPHQIPEGFHVWPGTGGKYLTCPQCDDHVMNNPEAIKAHQASHAEVAPSKGNGADHHAFEALMSHSDELKPYKAKPKKYKAGGVELYQCECGATNFDKEGFAAHTQNGHLKCTFCEPPSIIQSDHLKRHLQRVHPELVGKGKPRQS